MIDQFAMLDHMPMGAFVLQKDFNVIFWNSLLEDWTGINREQIVGRPIGAFFPHLNTPRYAIRIRDVFNTGMPFVFSSYLHNSIIPVTLPDNQLQIQSGTITRVPDVQSNECYVLFSIQDVTELTRRVSDYRDMRDQAQKEVKERKQAEAKLLDANLQLQTTLDTLQKTQSQLVESEKMAALGQLVAGIAHELNSPLGAIRSSIENMAQRLENTLNVLPAFFHELPPQHHQEFFALLDRARQRDLTVSPKEERKYRRALTAILEEQRVENAQKIADLLVDMGIYDAVEPFLPLLRDPIHEQMLEMAYKISGLQESAHTIMTASQRASKVVFALRTYARYDHSGEMIEANLLDGIETILTLYHNQIKHGVEVVRQYQNLPPIRCYPDELNQVWTNLIQNALQAMDYSGTLTITAGNSDERIMIAVTDTGKGIPEEIREKIFEPFFTTKPAGEGSGLGLDIVRKIVEKHRGTITVVSRPGQTTFTVALPYTADTKPDPQRSAPPGLDG